MPRTREKDTEHKICNYASHPSDGLSMDWPDIHPPLQPATAGDGVTAAVNGSNILLAVQSTRNGSFATIGCKSRSLEAEEKAPWHNLGSLGDPMAGWSSWLLIVLDATYDFYLRSDAYVTKNDMIKR